LAWATGIGFAASDAHPFASIDGVSSRCAVRTFSPATAWPDPKQSADPGTTGKPVTTGPMHAMRHRAPLLRFFPMGTSARVALRSESGRPSDLRGWPDVCGAARDGGRWGGSFDDVSSHEMTRPPSPAILPCRTRAANPVRVLTRDPAISSATALIVPPDRVMHHRAAWRGVPLPRSDTRGLAGAIGSSFLPAFLARRRSWVFLPFAGLLPHPGGSTFLSIRAHLSFSSRFRPDWFSSGARF